MVGSFGHTGSTTVSNRMKLPWTPAPGHLQRLESHLYLKKNYGHSDGSTSGNLTPETRTPSWLSITKDWHGAYADIIPHQSLTAISNRRGGQWWSNAIYYTAIVLVIEIGRKTASYAMIGCNQIRKLRQQGEICELYLCQKCQGSASAIVYSPPPVSASPTTTSKA